MLGYGQQASPPEDQEEQDLAMSMGETNGVATEIVRALERHLKKYPKSAKRNDIERALVKSAIELGDQQRILQYGERVLERDPNNLQVIDRVTTALLQSNTEARSLRAIDLAKRFEEIVRGVDKESVSSARDAARQRDEVDRGLSRALMNQARGLGQLGKIPEAVDSARKGYEVHLSQASAREYGMWLAKSGKHEEAARAYADAVTTPDPRAAEADRAADRKSMGEAWRKAKGSEAGLGDVLLASYDRTVALAAEREGKLKQLDPNRGITNPMEFTVTGINGDKLKLSSLRGKVVVLDFWATWCGPCRGQYPLYEEVKKKYKESGDVVFLAINTDEDHSIVKPFLEQNQWNKSVYFEDGLSRQLNVASIPTTMIFDKDGRLTSRMNGYVPERFVDMLSERIQEAIYREFRETRPVPRVGSKTAPPPSPAKN